MNKFLANLCCAFIWKKKNRKHFRKKYITKSKYEMLNDRYNQIFNLIKQIYISNNNLICHIDKQIENSFKKYVSITSLSDLDTSIKKFFDVNVKQNINRYIQTNLSTYNLHQITFPQFKNINQGKDVVLIASGPSLNKYKPIDNTINVGVNRSFQGSPVDLDYIFIQDYDGKTPEYIKELNKYNGNNCKKFYGLTTEYDIKKNRVIPENDCIEANAYRYRTDWENIPGFQTKFVYDIASQPLGCGGSIVFPAMQFILWTNPRRIYLVGCDCSNDGYFINNNEKNILPTDLIVNKWKEMKFFANRYYPEIEIISINPVGLKGIFKDIYQN